MTKHNDHFPAHPPGRGIFPLLFLLSLTFYFSFFLSAPCFASSHMTRFDVFNSKKMEFTFAEACSLLGPNQSIMIDYLDINRLGCMGKILSAHEFCKSKLGEDPGFMRGFIDKKNKHVVCQTGERIWAEWECQGHDNETSTGPGCDQGKSGCLEVKKLLAENLTLFHHSVTADYVKGKKTLSCHFTSKNYLTTSPPP